MGFKKVRREKHGEGWRPEHGCWINVRSRLRKCGLPCPAWLETYESFRAILGRLPSSEHRLVWDGTPDPTPENIRWQLPRNRRAAE